MWMAHANNGPQSTKWLQGKREDRRVGERGKAHKYTCHIDLLGLHTQGKGAGVKKTTDFGACRDLYGRRLRCVHVWNSSSWYHGLLGYLIFLSLITTGRHVNDEIRLKKWLEDKEQESESRGAWLAVMCCG